MTPPFAMHPLGPAAPTFEQLLGSVHWEDVANGRRGGVLVDASDGLVPIVRTTTRYQNPAQRFSAVHRELADRINRVTGLACRFNNALIEHYDQRYGKMGFHCDQALDLADESVIAIYSCYRSPHAAPSRRLVIEAKQGARERFEIAMDHGSVITFSLDTNRRFRHKIVPTPNEAESDRGADNEWLGVTLRRSKTLLDFGTGRPVLTDGTELALADDDRAKSFFALRSRENREVDFSYPVLPFTVSASDLLAPVAPATP